jgi:hypothetical protein
MSQTDPDHNETSLLLRADPASGAIVGTFFLAMCLAGPVGLVLAVVAWVVLDAIRRRKQRSVGPSTDLEPRDDDFAGRFHRLENEILKEDRPGGST